MLPCRPSAVLPLNCAVAVLPPYRPAAVAGLAAEAASSTVTKPPGLDVLLDLLGAYRSLRLRGCLLAPAGCSAAAAGAALLPPSSLPAPRCCRRRGLAGPPNAGACLTP